MKVARDLVLRFAERFPGRPIHVTGDAAYVSKDLRRGGWRCTQRPDHGRKAGALAAAPPGRVLQEERSIIKKAALLYRHSWPTRAASRRAIFECVEAFYNRERRQSTLGNLTSADYESAHTAACSG